MTLQYCITYNEGYKKKTIFNDQIWKENSKNLCHFGENICDISKWSAIIHGLPLGLGNTIADTQSPSDGFIGCLIFKKINIYIYIYIAKKLWQTIITICETKRRHKMKYPEVLSTIEIFPSNPCLWNYLTHSTTCVDLGYQFGSEGLGLGVPVFIFDVCLA